MLYDTSGGMFFCWLQFKQKTSHNDGMTTNVLVLVNLISITNG